MFKAVIFDIGQTLIEYNKPLNWSQLYRPAFETIAEKMKYHFSEQQYQYAINVLTKYNTRVNPRDYEVSSTQIFTEIINGMHLPLENMEQMKFHFYSFFRQEVSVFPEVEETLKEFCDKGILLGTLSDVAYGMDNAYALEDIAALRKYIAYPLTSNDVGYRKPSIEGLKILADKMQVSSSEMVFVGDEEKDMICANNAGVYSVLINRDGAVKQYGQKKEIHSFRELRNIVS